MMSTRCKLIVPLACILLVFSACSDSRDKKSDNHTTEDVLSEVKQDTISVEKIEQVKSRMSLYLEGLGLKDVQLLDSSIFVEIKYSTTDNFTKVVLYDSLYQAYLHPMAVDKLLRAQRLLKDGHPDLSLLIYDAARPMSVQKKMYAVVQNTPFHAYVANPSRTGMHNYGMAVDLTICDKDGDPLDMGTPFDFFGRAAGINKEDLLVSEGILTKEQVDNRKLLRRIMTDAGFIAIRGEWWHFNASSLEYAKNNMLLIE